MKIRKILRCEAANMICWFRIMVGVALALAGQKNLFWAVLCSVAFLSDLWDGWCYRRLSVVERPLHWFNRLPISMDPLADFVFVEGGLIYLSDQKMRTLGGVVLTAMFLLVWLVTARLASDRMYRVMMVFLTVGWFLAMLLLVIAVWLRSVNDTTIFLIGLWSTVGLFEIFRANLGEKPERYKKPR